jgi:hypothetical protein
MAKKEPVKPLFPIKHEFTASLDRFVHEAGMLRDCVHQLLQMGKIVGPGAEIIAERIKAFDLACFGDENGKGP